jgi:hypothetical protein
MKTVLFVLSLACHVRIERVRADDRDRGASRHVLDPSNAIIVGATVTVTGAEPATSAQSVPEAKSAENGIATFTGLTPGRYTIQADFPGFETRLLQEVRLRSGENRQVAILSISKLEASVTVEQDKQLAAADPAGRSFGTTLTREEIEALSDDPQMLQQQLQDMAGPGAGHSHRRLRGQRIAGEGADSIDPHFTGSVRGRIPQRGGRVDRNHHAAGPRAVRYFTNFRVRDDALTGTSPFVSSRGPERNTNFGGGMNGTLIKDKSSFGLFVFG